MKKLLILITAMTLCVSAFAQKKNPEMKVYDFAVTRVIDGDTVEFAAPFLPAPLKPKLAVRVFGVDTPEKGFRAQCESERKLSVKVKQPGLRSLTGTNTVAVYLEILF